MSVESFNTIELRYADSALAKNDFVKEVDYILLELELEQRDEEIEILRAERTHWHNMYNAESAPEIGATGRDDLANRRDF